MRQSGKERRIKSLTNEGLRHNKASNFVKQLLSFKQCELFHSMHEGHFNATVSYLCQKRFGNIRKLHAPHRQVYSASLLHLCPAVIARRKRLCFDDKVKSFPLWKKNEAAVCIFEWVFNPNWVGKMGHSTSSFLSRFLFPKKCCWCEY